MAISESVMDLETAKNIASRAIKKMVEEENGYALRVWQISRTMVRRFTEEEWCAFDAIERHVGEESANEWLCGVLGSTS